MNGHDELGYSGATLFKQIACKIGEDAAWRLVARFGGLRIYVPSFPTPEDQITRTIGSEAARTMGQAFGGDKIMVPRDPNRGRRIERISELRGQGLTVPAIARELRCTERTVYKLMKKNNRHRTQ